MLKKPLRLGRYCFDIIIFFGFVLFLVIKYRRRLRLYRQYVIDTEGGFGHSLVAPVFIHDFLKDPETCFIMMLYKNKHNVHIEQIRSEDKTIFFPLVVQLMGLEWSFKPGSRFVAKAAHWFQFFFGLFYKKTDQKIITLGDYYRNFLVHIQSSHQEKAHHWADWTDWFMHRLWLETSENQAPKIQLNPEIVQSVKEKIKVLQGSESQKPSCGIYLRQRPGYGDLATSTRNGSALSDYVSSLKLLVQSGYQILLTGDVPLTPSVRKEFGSSILDAEILGISKEIFDLFVGTQSQIFIGERGGGLWIPTLRGVPTLSLNAIPYFHGGPKTWVYYKTFWKDGQFLDPEVVFTKHSRAYDISGYSLRENGADEILEAVTTFLEDLKTPWKDSSPDEDYPWLPKNSWSYLSRGKISPAFLNRYTSVSKSKPAGNGSH